MKRFKKNTENDDMGVTLINNAFINHFMTNADGDSVKVYLYGLKCAGSDLNFFPSDADIAEALHISEAAVKKAWEYWKDEGIIDIDENNSIEYRNITPLFFASNGIDIKKKKSRKNLSRKIKEMFSEIETKISRPLVVNEHDIILDWIDEYGFSPQTVILLIDYCLTREGGRNTGYWIAVADNFHAENIKNYDEAKSFLEKRTENYKRNKEITDYLGLYRAPTEPEARIIKKWFDEYGYDMDTVKKACDETIKTNKPNFKYIDSILTAWHEGKEFFEPQVQSKGTKSANKKTRLKDEHNYDIEALEKALFGDEDKE